MARMDCFEEVGAWSKARELAQSVYAITNEERFARDFGLRNQIRKAAISVMANIAEGFERNGNAEFAQFLAVAKGSAGEVRAQLYVALDQGYIDQIVFDRVAETTREIGRMLAGLMSYLRRSGMKGAKFVTGTKGKRS